MSIQQLSYMFFSTYFYDILVCRYDSNGIFSLALHLRKENSLTLDVSGLFKSLTVTMSDSKIYLTRQTSLMINKMVPRY